MALPDDPVEVRGLEMVPNRRVAPAGRNPTHEIAPSPLSADAHVSNPTGGNESAGGENIFCLKIRVDAHRLF